MVKIYNSEVTTGLSKNAGIQTSSENPPNQLAEKIVPTFETNPEMLRRINRTLTATATNATSATLLATNTTEIRDFYIVSAQLSVIKDVTSTSITSELQVTLEDQPSGQPILKIPGLTLTAQSQSVAISFNNPIKIKRGSSIAVANSTNVANISASAVVHGYYVYTALA